MTDIEKELLGIGAELLIYARRLTKDKFRAEDLLQETSLKVLVQRDKYRENKCFAAWAKRIMLNSFLNNAEREERMSAVENYLDIYQGTNQMADRCIIASETEDIYNAVKQLPAENSKVITLLIDGHRYDEIAVILDIPLGTVKSRIFVSRAMLREELKDYFE